MGKCLKKNVAARSKNCKCQPGGSKCAGNCSSTGHGSGNCAPQVHFGIDACVSECDRESNGGNYIIVSAGTGPDDHSPATDQIIYLDCNERIHFYGDAIGVEATAGSARVRLIPRSVIYNSGGGQPSVPPVSTPPAVIVANPNGQLFLYQNVNNMVNPIPIVSNAVSPTIASAKPNFLTLFATTGTIQTFSPSGTTVNLSKTKPTQAGPEYTTTTTANNQTVYIIGSFTQCIEYSATVIEPGKLPSAESITVYDNSCTA